ncbi:MAG TPA: DUF1552 domain-containing protein, partial [Tepidisphaeraceae bacterium]
MRAISRRTMLRGAAGAVVGLPLLEAMGAFAPQTAAAAAGAGAAAKLPVRMAVLYMANGVNTEQWAPKAAGREFELSPILTPLAKHKDDLLVLTELWNAGSVGGDGHYVKTAGFLTGTTITKTTGKDLRSGGVSMDQLAAQRVGSQTPLPSLELGIEPVTNFVDNNVGYTALYGSHIAWATPTSPLAKEINPRLAFDRLFRSGGDAIGTPADDRSILDLVAEDAHSLRQRVGRADQRKLDEYFDSVRAVEKRIEFNTKQRAEDNKLPSAALAEIEALDKRIATWASPERQKLAANVRRSGDHTDHVRLMLDLMVLAFWTDSTRVSTFMFGNGVSPKNFSWLEGVKGGHHEISHHKNEKATLEMYARINRWHVEQFRYMLDKMAAIKEGENTLLDNSMLLFGSCMRDGNSHNPRNLPLVLAGKGGGTIKGGRHLVHKKNTSLCNLF